MCFVTVDVGVLMTASSGRDLFTDECIDALEAMRNSFCGIVIDTERQVRSDYERKMPGAGTFGLAWAQDMIDAGRIELVRRIGVSKGQVEKLVREGFHIANPDFKIYTRTAAASADKIVLSLDPHFFKRSKDLRRIFGIRVYHPKDFRDLPTH